MAAKGRPTGKKAVKATAVSLAIAALQDEEVQRRLKAAGAVGLARLRNWNQEHGPLKVPDAAALTETTKRATKQGRLEVRLARLTEAEEALRASGQTGARIDWLGQTLDEASTALAVAKSLPRDKRRVADETVDELLTSIEDALFASVRRPSS